MANIRTHYDNLKVARDAPVGVIKAAYKALSQTYHPDKYKGDNEEAERIMKIINTSYGVLIDSHLRALHNSWIKNKEAESHEQYHHQRLDHLKTAKLYSLTKAKHHSYYASNEAELEQSHKVRSGISIRV